MKKIISSIILAAVLTACNTSIPDEEIKEIIKKEQAEEIVEESPEEPVVTEEIVEDEQEKINARWEHENKNYVPLEIRKDYTIEGSWSYENVREELRKEQELKFGFNNLEEVKQYYSGMVFHIISYEEEREELVDGEIVKVAAEPYIYTENFSDRGEFNSASYREGYEEFCINDFTYAIRSGEIWTFTHSDGTKEIFDNTTTSEWWGA
jgi:hypothetical protein